MFYKKILMIFIIILSFCSCAFAAMGKWENPKNIKTYIQPAHARTTMMKHAFAEWSKLTKNKVVFYYVNNPKLAQIQVTFVEKITEQGGHTDKSIGLTKGIYLVSGKMTHATIWIATKTQEGKTLSDDEVYTVMLHEIGHAIGLEHSNDPKSVMYPQVDVVQEIDKADLVTLSHKYGWK